MKKISLDSVFSISPEIVVRNIDGEILIVPLTSRVAAGEDHLFSLNPTGREIWSSFDGTTSLRSIIDHLEKKYACGDTVNSRKPSPIEKDVLGLTGELVARHMLVVATQTVSREAKPSVMRTKPSAKKAKPVAKKSKPSTRHAKLVAKTSPSGAKPTPVLKKQAASVVKTSSAVGKNPGTKRT